MSLFPAYCEQLQENKEKPSNETEWLNNSSFAVKFPSQTIDLSKSNEEKLLNKILPTTSKVKKKKRDKKKNKKKEKREKSYKQEEIQLERNDTFFIDKERRMVNLTMKTLPKESVPKYFLRYPGLIPEFMAYKKKKFQRYFKFVDSSEGWKEGSLEEENLVSEKKREFNEKLGEDPHNISTWLEFVKFQDEFFKYQHIKYKSFAERERATAQHKLSLLDKAVSQNPDNKELQALWLKIGTSVLPSEEMSTRIEKILEDSGGTMTLWLGLMTTTQHSLARCTVPSVTKLYEKLLLNFQKDRQPDVCARDLNVLELLFHYGRFLDNCGHWEILWMMIKVNLHLNTKADLSLDLKVDEKVKQLENVVLEREKQAIWQLWSQLERIREGLHFLPDNDSIDYPQRCVSYENIVSFTRHFHPNLHFQLIVSFIVLLKVPLLPTTHTIFKMLSPNSLPWVFDSPEYILSAVMTTPAINLQYTFLYPVTHLSRGPQYLRKFHGQTEFLHLISHTFESCMKCLEGKQKTALSVWLLRFERWIHHLSKLNLSFLPDDRKSAKSFFKDFLKVPDNRDNLLYYIEYSLLEYNLGNTEICIKTLKTLISSRPPVLSLADADEKAVTTSAYRSLCEVLVGTNQVKDALNFLIYLGSGSAPGTEVTIYLLASAEKKFEHISIESIRNLDSSGSIDDLLLPIFAVEWISCYFWLIALRKSSSLLKECYKKIFDLLDDKNSIIAEQTRECLWETIITISWITEKNNFIYIKEILKQTFTKFPRNLKLLTFMADASIRKNEYWWALKKTFLSVPTPFSSIFLICLGLDRFEKDKENLKNRVINLFKDLTLREGKLSSIVHSLRLRFLYENEDSLLDDAQLQALEACPWHKSIFMESILLLPAKLMQLTDVLIEKELRIHITPDEIQEMRD